jgi:uncharacterized repeat protein (TIGR01451 family)
MKKTFLFAALLLCLAGGAQAQSDLGLEKYADAESYAYNDTVTYDLYLTNYSYNVPVIEVQDVIPAGLTYVSATITGGGSCQYDSPSTTVSCFVLGALPYYPYTVTIKATVNTTATTTITNTAEAICYSGDPDLSNNTASVDINVN